MKTDTQPVLVKGRNYWEMGRAHRVSFLIDASSYFSAFRDAALKARRTIYITGWDIDSRTMLVREDPSSGIPVRLGEFLDHIASRRPSLDIYILLWDYAILYALDREPFPVWVYDWKANRRIHFYQDNFLPMGASHHQKIVVVDDEVAFVGGIDLTNRRWDESDHLPFDLRRIDPWGKEYPPFHDVQLLVDGPVAHLLGDLFRSRWLNATSREIVRPGRADADPWPSGCEPDIREIDVAISRTEPAFKGRTEVREVESLWVDAIASAKRRIYIENPFFTSWKVADAIASRLREKDGPEVLLVTRKKSHGWLEEYTMDAIRSHLVEKVRKLDPWGRFGCFYPTIPGQDDVLIDVHSKLLIVDDTFVRVGSSNLANRSMGLDTECDLSMETAAHNQARSFCCSLLNRLLAEHVGSTPEEVGAAVERTGSLIRAVETMRGTGRALTPLEASPLEKNILAEPYFVDPERPIRAESFVRRFVGEEHRRSSRRRIAGFALLVLLLTALALLWRFSALSAYLDASTIAEGLQGIRGNPMAPLIVLALYVAGGIVVFPVLLLIVITSLLFEPLTAFALAMAGSLLSGVCLYWIGHALGRSFVQHLAGRRINSLSERLGRRGILTVIILRIVPVAPYSIVNLLAGASHIVFRDFLIGTAIGMFPGIFAITIFTESLKNFILEPSIANVAILAGSMILSVALLVWISKITRRASGKSSRQGGP
ncbi:MAG TPA: VTT domain-containing protein [Deltaproteobacteria bacterium]|nr:VTT domain-containing protein [Deltaproteobacteria bacterium]HOI07026.1 VTT domain-containing protein [Deltaproteobacteria bacterium]